MHRSMLKDLPLSDVYCLIEPGPVVMLSTSRNGRPNLMTMSWHMMVEFEPPMIACVVSSGNDSFEALRIAKECVIAIPDVRLAEKVVAVGNCHGRDLDKFAAVGLSTIPGERVLAPLPLPQIFANLDEGGRHTTGEQIQPVCRGRCSRRGLTPHRRAREQFIIAAMARSSWTAKQSN